jgi:hypothetical protein
MQRKNLDAVESDDPRKAEITLKAATTVTTEEGAFTAVISTESVDREGDVVDADGSSLTAGSIRPPTAASRSGGSSRAARSDSASAT